MRTLPRVAEYFGDSTQLIYLRARYYNPAEGRFISRDTWSGDVNRPLSLNHWMYVDGNPINATDPSGYITENQAKRAAVIVDKLELYGVHIVRDWYYELVPDSPNGGPWVCKWQEGNWRNVRELELTFEAVKLMAKELGGADKFRSAMKGHIVDIKRYTDYSNWAGFAPHPAIDQFFGEAMLFNGAFNSSEERAKGYVVHELAHVWDFRKVA